MCCSKSVCFAVVGLFAFALICVSADGQEVLVDEHEMMVIDEHGDVVYYEDEDHAVLVDEHEMMVIDGHGDVVYYEDDG